MRVPPRCIILGTVHYKMKDSLANSGQLTAGKLPEDNSPAIERLQAATAATAADLTV